jgi:2,4-diaminopentanoate dehydrogenase
MSLTQQNPRIVVYGTGQFGQYFTQLAVQQGFEIRAAFNRAGAKVGQDLGRLSGLGRELGVVVQDCDTASYDNLDADVAIVATTDRLSQNMPAYERLMNGGLNIICHGAESSFPYGVDQALATRIDELARMNGVSFTGTGVWDSYRIWPALVACGPCTEIHSIYHHSMSDASTTGKELMLAVGVGMTVDEFDREIVRKPGLVGGYYNTVPQHVLTALGYTVTSATEHRQPIVFEESIYSELLGQDVAPGLVVGTRIVAEVTSRQGLSILMHHDGRLFRPGEREFATWSIEGKPSVKIRMERENVVHFSTGSMINRVHDIIAAPPGIRLVSQLGPLRHRAPN